MSVSPPTGMVGEAGLEVGLMNGGFTLVVFGNSHLVVTARFSGSDRLTVDSRALITI